MLLAIDTATRLLSVALHDGCALLAESTLTVERNHGKMLAPLVEQTLEQVGVSADDLTALAVSIGPGSYTGLRIGVAMAKGIAAVRDLPLVPVTTLDTIAAAIDCPRAIVTVPAGRNRVIWALYQDDGGRLLAQNEAKLGSWDELLADCSQACALTGEITSAGLQQLMAAIESGRPITLMPAAQRLRRAGFLAEIAWQRLRHEGMLAFPAAAAMPVYLKSP